MKTSTKYSREVRERAVRMVLEHQDEHESQWATISPIAAKINGTTETLCRWVRADLEGAAIAPSTYYLHGRAARRSQSAIGSYSA